MLTPPCPRRDRGLRALIRSGTAASASLIRGGTRPLSLLVHGGKRPLRRLAHSRDGASDPSSAAGPRPPLPSSAAGCWPPPSSSAARRGLRLLIRGEDVASAPPRPRRDRGLHPLVRLLVRGGTRPLRLLISGGTRPLRLLVHGGTRVSRPPRLPRPRWDRRPPSPSPWRTRPPRARPRRDGSFRLTVWSSRSRRAPRRRITASFLSRQRATRLSKVFFTVLYLYCTRLTPANYHHGGPKSQVGRSASNQAGPSAGHHGRCADCIIRGLFRRAAAVGRAVVPLYFLVSSKKDRFLRTRALKLLEVSIREN